MDTIGKGDAIQYRRDCVDKKLWDTGLGVVEESDPNRPLVVVKWNGSDSECNVLRRNIELVHRRFDIKVETFIVKGGKRMRNAE